jgi:hypothetical protein
MNVAKIVGTLGIMVILPSAVSAQPEPKAVVCSPAFQDCPAQALMAAFPNDDCDKHGTTSPTSMSDTTGTPVEQPCKGLMKQNTAAQPGTATEAGTDAGTENGTEKGTGAKTNSGSGSGGSIDLKRD